MSGELVALNHIDATDLADVMAILKAPGVFDETQERIVEGICSSDRVDSKGQSLSPSGAFWQTPLPLLLRHSWFHPIGIVFEVKQVARSLRFRARVSTTLADAVDAWAAVLRRELLCASVGRGWESTPTSLLPDGTVTQHTTVREWQLAEISLCPKGANPDARIERVATYERPKGVIVADPYDTRWRRLHIDDAPVVRLRPARLEAAR